MAKMLGHRYDVYKCPYGCCRIFGISHKAKVAEKRMVKRRERQGWKKDLP